MDNLAIKLAETEARSKSNSHRLDKLEKDQTALIELATAVKLMAQAQEYQNEALEGIREEVSKLDTKVEALEKVPAEHWKTAVGVVIAVAVTFLLAQFGVS